jgi:hypothetical protein
VYNAISTIALSKRSGGIDGRPTDEYIWSKTGDSSNNAAFASFLIPRSGCVAGTRDSGDISISIDDCLVFSPRMVRRR